MSSLGSPSTLFLAKKEAYTVERSLRFNRADNAVLTRSPSSTTNSTKQTLSFWFKIGTLIDATNQGVLFAGGSDGNYSYVQLWSNTFYFGNSAGTYWNGNLALRDFSAWYHAVLVIDTTLSTANDRQKLYINGVEQERGGGSNPSQDSNYEFLTNSSWTYYIGKRAANDMNFEGYMAEINFVQGLALDASYFGETDPLTGQWNPKKYTGSYGTNGFYLNFSDNSATSATTMGKDNSGNGNNFTPNNFATTDAVKDSPTNNFCVFNPSSKDGGTTLSEGNLKISSSNYGNNTGTFFLTSGKWYWEGLGDGYVVAICGNAGQNFATSLSGSGSKSIGYWFGGQAYWDGGNSGTETSYSSTDIVAAALDMDNGSIKFYKNNTLIYDLTFGSGTVPDLSAGVFPNYNNGGVSASRTVNFNFGQDSSFAGNKTAQGNADGNGIGDFYYAPPSGHLAICSANLPDPTILLPNKHFDTLLYSGNGSDNRDITGLNFAPDWVWLKRRDGSMGHNLGDTVRGANKILFSNSSNAEMTDETDRIKAFNSDGFRLGTDSAVNYNGYTYVAWNWDAGETDGKTYTVTVVDDSGNKFRFDGFGTSAVTLDLAEGGTYIFNYPSGHPFRFSTTADGTHGGGSEYTTGVTHNSSTQVTIAVAASAPQLYYYCASHSGMGGAVNTNSTLGSSNFDGSVQSTAKVNATAGFSIVTLNGTGSVLTFGHGLGVKPTAVILKARNIANNWLVFHQGYGATKTTFLDTSGATSDNAQWYNDTEPTSSVFTLGTWSGMNTSTPSTIVAYCFSEVAGYSKFGSYTGNGNADGTFVFLGFRPAWVMIKNTSGTGLWIIADATINSSNVVSTYLQAQGSNAEYTGYSWIDLLSNGFKARNTGSSFNTNGSTMIYLAFAESPFKNARAR